MGDLQREHRVGGATALSVLTVSGTPGHPESGRAEPGDQRMRHREAFSSGGVPALAALPLALS